MNHYERLKVTQDAPPEVIRAAYRALAQALPQDEHREARLTELNTAYETLIDPELRQAYDTVLTVSVPDIVVDEDASLDITLDALALPPEAFASADGGGNTPGAAAEAAQVDQDMVDPWQGAYEASAYQPPKHWSRQPVVWMGGGLVLLLGFAWMRWVRRQTMSFSSMVAMGMGCPNSGFVGYPVALLVLGGSVASVSLALNMVVENLLLIPALLVLSDLGDRRKGAWHAVLWQSLKGLARNPMVLSIAAGILASWAGVALPAALSRTVQLFAQAKFKSQLGNNKQWADKKAN